MGSSTVERGAPAQVVYQPSAIMRDWRTEVALMRLRVAGTMARVITDEAPDDGPVTTHELLGTRDPEVPVGRTFGPTHNRRSRARTRIAVNSAGLPITHERITRRPPAPASALDVAPRCHLTDLIVNTCAHCLGHNTEED